MFKQWLGPFIAKFLKLCLIEKKQLAGAEQERGAVGAVLLTIIIGKGDTELLQALMLD